jgi:hypothetical protein
VDLNEVDWNLDINDPRLWWPWTLGEQQLTEVEVEISVDELVSDTRSVRTGLREVVLQDWVFTVNGEPMFVKGANLAPTRMALGDATPTEMRRDVELAREAGLDLLRVHGHISRPELYDAADELGMLLWQDFPLQWGYARTIRKEAVRQAREAVDQLGHHPSIAVWCAHNEPVAPNLDPSEETGKASIRYITGQQLPSWNKTVLDRWVKRAFEQADETRTTIAHSGVMPHLPMLDGTDSHLYFGWYHGHERDLSGFAASMPRMVRFVSEFGAQAVPAAAEFMEPERWPNLDWDRLQERNGLQLPRLRTVRPAGRLRDVRRVARCNAAVPGQGVAPSHRDVAAAEVPADRRVLLLHVQRRSADGVVERARPRTASEVGLPSGRRCLPARDRRRRSPARHVCRSARRWRSMCTWSATCAGSSKTPCARPSSVGRVDHMPGAGAATCHRIPACASAPSSSWSPISPASCGWTSSSNTATRSPRIGTSAPSSADVSLSATVLSLTTVRATRPAVIRRKQMATKAHHEAGSPLRRQPPDRQGDGGRPGAGLHRSDAGLEARRRRRARRAHRAHRPDVHKAVKWNSPFYGVEGQGWFLNFHCFTKYVKVAFFRGTSLLRSARRVQARRKCATSTSTRTTRSTKTQFAAGSSKPANFPAKTSETSVCRPTGVHGNTPMDWGRETQRRLSSFRFANLALR